MKSICRGNSDEHIRSRLCVISLSVCYHAAVLLINWMVEYSSSEQPRAEVWTNFTSSCGLHAACISNRSGPLVGVGVFAWKKSERWCSCSVECTVIHQPDCGTPGLSCTPVSSWPLCSALETRHLIIYENSINASLFPRSTEWFQLNEPSWSHKPD